MQEQEQEQAKVVPVKLSLPTIGRIVHYTLAEGVVRPAIVVRTWSGEAVNLEVFTDGSNDDPYLDPTERSTSPTDTFPGKRADRVVWRTSVLHGTERDSGTWHWPPRA